MRTHADFCEADTGHDQDCSTATELGRLRAFAEAVRDEWECTMEGELLPDDHVDDCWRCAALQALERVR